MKLEELRRRYTGPIGCPSDTKDPDYWDWDNWDNWPEEDKEMFPIEEEMNLHEDLWFGAKGKETQDPDTWHDGADYKWIEENAITTHKTDIPELEEISTELGYVYLYKGKYLAQADNGGVQIDHPAPEEVIQWFFDHYGKRLWESNMKNRFNEGRGIDSLYDRICRALTDYEHNGEEETNFEELPNEYFEEEFYNLLVDVLVNSDIKDYDEDLANKIDLTFTFKKPEPGKSITLVTVDKLYDLLVEVQDDFVDAGVKDNFNESVKRTGKSLREDVSFIDRWHDTHELLPDCDNVWFIADGKIYVGLYEPEQQIFCMADGLGVELKEVRQWKYLSDKEVIGYPKEKEIIAIENPDFPCPITGIFSDHLICEETGDEFSGVLLDEEYEFCKNGCDSLPWEDVFAWYHLPEEPLKVLEPTDVYPIAIDTPFKTDETVEDIVEDGAAPTVMEPTETVEDIAGPNPEPIIEEGEAEVIPTAEGESAIAASKTEEEPIEEEERLVRESVEDPLDLKVAKWYKETYPTDSMGDEIDDYITFNHIFNCLDSYDDIYQYIPGDSVIRERVFEKLAELLDVNYDYVYNQWLRCADHKVDWNRINPKTVKDLYNKGQITKSEYDEMMGHVKDAKGSLNESIRGNTRKFLDNVYEYFNGFFDGGNDYNWDNLEADLGALKRFTKYKSMNEAIKEYVEGGYLDVYYSDIRNVLNKLYENTPEEVEKWADYPTNKLWDRYVAICQIYLPKAFKHFTGRELGEGEELTEAQLKEAGLLGKAANWVGNKIQNGVQKAANWIGKTAGKAVNAAKTGYQQGAGIDPNQQQQTQQTQQLAAPATQGTNPPNPAQVNQMLANVGQNGQSGQTAQTTNTQTTAPAAQNSPADAQNTNVQVDANTAQNAVSPEQVTELKTQLDNQADAMKDIAAKVETQGQAIEQLQNGASKGEESGGAKEGEGAEAVEGMGDAGTEKLAASMTRRSDRFKESYRYNKKNNNRIFENNKALDMKKCKFMLDKGVSREDIDKARMDGRVGQLLDTRGLHDEFWNSCEGE